MSYYYLISSFPGISLDSKPMITLDAFRRSCGGQLSSADQEALDAILSPEIPEGDSPSHPFVLQWFARETQLRNAAARQRAAKQQTDAGDFVRIHSGFDVALEESVDNAFAQPTPLAREQALDRARWNVLDELVGPHLFSAAAVLAYALKLQIAERWASRDETLGQARISEALVSGNRETSQEDSRASAS